MPKCAVTGRSGCGWVNGVKAGTRLDHQIDAPELAVSGVGWSQMYAEGISWGS